MPASRDVSVSERFRNRVGTEFVGLPTEPSATRYFMFLEIVAGTGFDGEFLYVCSPPRLCVAVVEKCFSRCARDRARRGVEYEVKLPRASGWRVVSDLCDTMPQRLTGASQYVRGCRRDWPWAADLTVITPREGSTAIPAPEPATTPHPFGGVAVHHFGFPVELQFMNYEDRSSVPSKSAVDWRVCFAIKRRRSVWCSHVPVLVLAVMSQALMFLCLCWL